MWGVTTESIIIAIVKAQAMNHIFIRAIADSNAALLIFILSEM